MSKSFKWPSQIRGPLRTIKIKYYNRKRMMEVNRDYFDSESLLGRMWFNRDEMHICTENPKQWLQDLKKTELDPIDIFNTILHEYLHVLSDQYGFDFKEVDVNVLSIEFLNILRACGIEFPKIKRRKR